MTNYSFNHSWFCFTSPFPAPTYLLQLPQYICTCSCHFLECFFFTKEFWTSDPSHFLGYSSNITFPGEIYYTSYPRKLLSTLAQYERSEYHFYRTYYNFEIDFLFTYLKFWMFKLLLTESFPPLTKYWTSMGKNRLSCLLNPHDLALYVTFKHYV